MGDELPDREVQGDATEGLEFPTSLRTMALTAHEAYAEFLTVGFDPNQALYLTAQCITGGKGTAP